MAFIPPSKLSGYPGQGGKQTGASPEGINAFLSRVKQAQTSADQAADLKMQEQVASGTVSVDQQIKYNRDRQQRFLPSTKEYQQLENNIADLNVAKKWQVQSTMDATGSPKVDQIQFLKQWHGTLTPGSDLANQLVDKIGKLQIQANQDQFAKDYESKLAEFTQGKSERQAVISYLESQLSATSNPDLKQQIQGDLDTHRQGMLSDAQKFAYTAATAFDNTGNSKSEGIELGLLENAKQKAQVAGDAAAVAARSGDIDTAKRRLIAASIDEQLQGAQLDTISKPGTASNEKYLATLQGLQQKQSGDFSYTGVHGETRTLHMDNLQNINLGSGQFNGAPLGTAVNEKLSKFIQGSYIPDKVAEITNKFSTLQNTAGVNYEKLLSTAQSISQDWNTFKSKQFLQPFALQLSTADQNQVSSFMAQGLINELDNKFTSNGIDDKGAMAQFTKIQQLFPTATGTDFENKKLNLEKNIANPNYQNFVNDNSSQLDTEINHVQSAMSTIQSNASGSNPDGTSRAFDHGAYNKLNADLQTLTTAKSTFHNSYGSNYLDQNYSKFLPDKTGKIAPPTFTLPKTSGVAGSILPLPKSVAPAPHTGNFYSSNNQGTNQGTQNQTTSPKTTIGSTAIGKAIPNGDILKKYQPSETIKQGNGFYLKPGIDQRW